MLGPRVALIWRCVFTAVGGFALGLQYWLMIIGSPDQNVWVLTLNFFSFFTILTNVLVFAAMALPVVAAGTAAGRWAKAEGVRAGTTMYAAVVGLVYHLLLHATWNPQGWLFVSNVLLHYAMPTAMLLDWLMFTPKGRLRWIDAVKWLAFPLLYGGWTLIHGLMTHWWPYWFINVDALGLGPAALSFGGLLVFFLIIGLAVVAIDRLFGRRDRTAVAA